MRPNFEPFVHTARDLLERNITLYVMFTGQIWKQLLSQSDIPEYRKIAESMIISESVGQYNAMTKNEMLSRGTHAMMTSFMAPSQLAWAKEVDPDQEYMNQKGEYKYNYGRGYYRGEMVVLTGDTGLGGYLTNKKWHLNEVYLLLREFKINVLKYAYLMFSLLSTINLSCIWNLSGY